MSDSENAGRFDAMVLRMVLAGDSKDEVLYRLKVNEIIGDEADLIYFAAFRERVATLRQDAIRKARKGFLLCLFCASVLGGSGYLFAVRQNGAIYFYIPKPLIGLGSAGFLWGIWLLIDGVAAYLMAASKEGPI